MVSSKFWLHIEEETGIQSGIGVFLSQYMPFLIHFLYVAVKTNRETAKKKVRKEESGHSIDQFSLTCTTTMPKAS